MAARERWRIRFQGSPDDVEELVRSLEAAGLAPEPFELQPPQGRGGLGGLPHEILVQLVAGGLKDAIEAAVVAWWARIKPGRPGSSVEVGPAPDPLPERNVYPVDGPAAGGPSFPSRLPAGEEKLVQAPDGVLAFYKITGDVYRDGVKAVHNGPWPAP